VSASHFKFKSVIRLLIAPHFQRILSAPPPNYKRHTMTNAYPSRPFLGRRISSPFSPFSAFGLSLPSGSSEWPILLLY
jgi:hypothetical protein